MAKRKPAMSAPEAPPPQETPPPQTPVQETPSEDTIPIVLVGDVVWTIDRSRFMAARDRGIEPQPLAGVVTAIHRDKQGQRDGLLNIMLADPAAGCYPLSDVRYSATLKPNHWTPRPQAGRVSIPMTMLTEAVRMAIEQLHPAAAEEESADAEA